MSSTLLNEPITAAVVNRPGGPFELEQVNIADLRPGEVLVRMVAAGMCHTDLVARNQIIPTPLPAIFGHEGAGIVDAVGDKVDHVGVGDHVVLTYLSCGKCRECLTGVPASCGHFGALCFSGARIDGTHPLRREGGGTVSDRFFGQSSFATYAVADERNVVKVREDAPLRLLGPLGCGIMTGAGAIWNELNVSPGSSCVIYGAGAVGLSAIMAARIAGASTIIAVDRIATRLDLARQLGATAVVNAQEAGDLVSAIRGMTRGGADFAFDTTGNNAVIKMAVQALGQRGAAAIVASSQPGLELDVSDLIMGNKTLRGVIEGGGSPHIMIPRLIDFYLNGDFPFDRMVEYYPFDEINRAAKDSENGVTIKPILLFA